MKKHPKGNRTLARTSRRLTIIGIAAVGLVALGTATAISRQEIDSKNLDHSQQRSTDTKYVTARVAGQEVHVDSQTGKIKPLSPQEAEKLAAGLKQMLDQSTEGLVQVHHADGSVTMDLQDRFQNVTVARINDDGSITQACVDNPGAAAAFFGIEPQLLEDGPTAGKPNRLAPAKTPNR